VAGFRKVREDVLHEGRLISLAVGTFADPDGEEFERQLVHHPGAVSMVPLHADGTVVLVRQYRAAVDRELLEIPAGKRDVPDEPPETTAERELAEEVGLRAGRLEKLCEFYNSPGFCDEHSYVFLARDLEDVESSAHGPEERHMTIERVSLAEAARLIDAGEITDAKTIIGLSLAMRRVT
jgi:8-oxo-dGTP pyrophosphatase MutT (NUDIX family)